MASTLLSRTCWVRTLTKPPFPYYGGKQRIAEKIIATFPTHGHYVEPFAGGLSVLLAKEKTKHETVNDLDGRLMNFWQVLRDQPEELYAACFFTPWSKLELSNAISSSNSDSNIESARKVWVQLTQGRGAILSNTGWRFVTDPKSPTSMSTYRDGYVSRLMPAAQRLYGVNLESRDALKVISTYGKAGALLYVDPPYLAETRSGTGYGVEMAGISEHEELAEALVSTNAFVCLSGYDSPAYERLYPGWNRVEIKARANSGSRTEVLWMNY